MESLAAIDKIRVITLAQMRIGSIHARAKPSPQHKNTITRAQHTSVTSNNSKTTLESQ